MSGTDARASIINKTKIMPIENSSSLRATAIYPALTTTVNAKSTSAICVIQTDGGRLTLVSMGRGCGDITGDLDGREALDCQPTRSAETAATPPNQGGEFKATKGRFMTDLPFGCGHYLSCLGNWRRHRSSRDIDEHGEGFCRTNMFFFAD